jgi:glutamyl-tRNA reductase
VQKTFYAVGLNHRTASVAASEAFALGEASQERVHAAFRAEVAAPDEDGPELVLLSTCNRTEAYCYGTEADVERVQALLACEAGQDWPSAGDTFRRTDEAAVQHVVEVAAGLRSLVPGDAQILAQVKQAYRRAVEADAVGMVGHRLMHTAFRAAKRVNGETSLSSGAASISTAAVALAETFFQSRHPGDPSGQRALLVGAGKMGRLALRALTDRAEAPASIAVTNRSERRAADAAEAFEAELVPWNERHAAAARADVVIVATGAEEPVLRAEALPERTPAADTSTLVVDIARPRNADPAIGEKPGYALRDMDDLQAWTREAESARREAVPEAEAICTEERQEFVSWVFHQEAMQPAIQAIRSTFESIRQQEIERHAHRFAEADAGDLERLTQSILQKLLAVPIVRLKGMGAGSMKFTKGIRLLESLFSRSGCEDKEDEATEALPEGHPPAATGEDRPVDAPARCPFETHAAGRSEDRPAAGTLRHARALLDALDGGELPEASAGETASAGDDAPQGALPVRDRC